MRVPLKGYYKGTIRVPLKGYYKGTIRVPLKSSRRFRVSENQGYLISGPCHKDPTI